MPLDELFVKDAGLFGCPLSGVVLLDDIVDEVVECRGCMDKAPHSQGINTGGEMVSFSLDREWGSPGLPSWDNQESGMDREPR
jgi:hypothetical protein